MFALVKLTWSLQPLALRSLQALERLLDLKAYMCELLQALRDEHASPAAACVAKPFHRAIAASGQASSVDPDVEVRCCR
jgi:hypothetical protein